MVKFGKLYALKYIVSIGKLQTKCRVKIAKLQTKYMVKFDKLHTVKCMHDKVQ